MRELFCTISIVCLLLSSCSETDPLKIGFLGSLSGRAAEVSQAARDGVLMAVEQINSQGGIDGRQVEMVVFDDRHDAATARAGVNSLADAGVAAIIGPITSQMSVAAVPEADIRKTLLVSPTSSTIELAGKEDYFFRTIPTCEANARRLALHAVEELNVRRVAIVQDLSNQAFTEPWQHCFGDQITMMGGEIVANKTTFNSLTEDFSFLELAKQALEHNPDALLILANSIDTALFSQQVSKLSSQKILLGSDWAFSGDLVQYGGSSVERFTFTTTVDMESDSPRFKSFKEDFTARFGAQPKFPSALAYEATNVTLAALAKNQDPARLRETISALGPIDGLQHKFQIDRFGDIERATYINQVQNGHFVKLKEVSKAGL